MNEPLFSLEEWTAKVSVSANRNVRTLLARFQRHWYEGHLLNPLLFPMEQTNPTWKAHLDWFLTVEKFQLPDRKTKKQPEVGVKRGHLTAPPPSESAETVFFNVENDDRGGKTVIYDPPAAEPGEPGELDELSDLGTLIVESRKKETGTVIIDEAPQARAETVPKTGKRVRDVKPASDKTILIDQTSSAGGGAGEEQADQTILIDRPYSLERETPQAETVIYGPGEAAGETVTASGQSTMISGQDLKTSDVDKETIIMEAGATRLKTGHRKKSAHAGAHPFPEPDRLRKEGKKEAPKSPPPDVDLDLEDLDTMVWLEDEDQPDN